MMKKPALRDKIGTSRTFLRRSINGEKQTIPAFVFLLFAFEKFLAVNEATQYKQKKRGRICADLQDLSVRQKMPALF